MKIEAFKIHKTTSGACLIPHLNPSPDGEKKKVAFYIKGKYFTAKKAHNLYNRTTPNLILPRGPLALIMSDIFPCGDVICYAVDRGVDIEIVVE